MSHRIFISYAHEDREFARLLDASLATAGIATTRDERDLLIGDSIPDWIFRSIAESTVVIHVLSASSLASAWAREELSAAQARQKVDVGFTLSPVLIDDVTLPHSLAHVRFADFRQWRSSEDYRVATMALLASLGIETPMLEGAEVEWWLVHASTLRRSYDALMIAFGYLDAAVGWVQWHSSIKWVTKELHDSEYAAALAAIGEILPANEVSPRFQALDEALRAVRGCGTFFDGLDRPAIQGARNLWVSLGRLLAMMAELEAEALVVLRSAVSLPRADGQPTSDADGGSVAIPVGNGLAGAGERRPAALLTAAGAAQVVEKDRPGEVDVVWAAYMADRSAVNRERLADRLTPVVGAVLERERQALAKEAERQMQRLGPVASSAEDPAEQRKAQATIDALQTVVLPEDAPGELMERALAACHHHPTDLGYSVTLTVTDGIAQIATELREVALRSAYAAARDRLSPVAAPPSQPQATPASSQRSTRIRRLLGSVRRRR